MTSGPNPEPTSGADRGDSLLLGRYALQETRGRGGMATVYRATDTVLDRSVAIKLLHPSISREPGFVEQFLAMERRIAGLFHPHLVTIFDAGTANEGCFVVMEYVAGGSLRDLLSGGDLLPIPDVTRITSQVAEALRVLHAERIIHGDIKPDNVLLDDNGNAKLVDFGIAHLATTTGGIRSESLGGSVPYLAPEQLEHGRADARSDIYSLGLVSYELLAGQKAFDGENWVAVAAQRLARDPSPLRELRPELPPQLERVIMQALARDPARRFPSAEEFQTAILQAPLQVAQPFPPPSAVEGSPASPLPRAVEAPPATPLPDAIEGSPASPLPSAVEGSPASPLPREVESSPASPLPRVVEGSPASPLPREVESSPASPLPSSVEDSPASPLLRGGEGQGEGTAEREPALQTEASPSESPPAAPSPAEPPERPSPERLASSLESRTTPDRPVELTQPTRPVRVGVQAAGARVAASAPRPPTAAQPRPTRVAIRPRPSPRAGSLAGILRGDHPLWLPITAGAVIVDLLLLLLILVIAR